MAKKLWLGMLVFALVFGMMVIGCDDGGGNGNGGSGGNGGGSGGSGFLGTTLNLSGQVWTCDWDEDNNIFWTRFTENRTITAAAYEYWDRITDTDYYFNFAVNGLITNGQLNLTVGIPTELRGIQDFNWLEELFNNFKISDTNTRIASISRLVTSDGGYDSSTLYRTFYSVDAQGSFDTQESVQYIYVDRDVTITGDSKTSTDTCNCIECDCVEYDGSCDCGYTVTTQRLNLNLKAGWNVLYFRQTYNERRTSTFSFTTGNPSYLRWELVEYNFY